MERYSCFFSGLFVFLGVTIGFAAVFAQAAAQQSCQFQFAPVYEQLHVLTDELNQTTNHSKTETSSEMSNTTDQRHETWYVGAPVPQTSCSQTGFGGQCCPGADEGNLYRTFQGTIFRDSPNATDPGFSIDKLIGCPYISLSHAGTGTSRLGLTTMRRYHSNTGTDYKTWLFSPSPTGYSTDATWFLTGATPRLGYQRFGNPIATKDQIIAAAYDSQHTLSNGYMSVQLNKIWGDGIGQITVGTTPIVEDGIGEMVQTVLRFGTGCRQGNPTQSGGIDCSGIDAPQGLQSRWTGSPVMSEALTGTLPAPQSFTAKVRPFDFCHDPNNADFASWPGTNRDDPLAFRGYFTRTDTLGCT